MSKVRGSEKNKKGGGLRVIYRWKRFKSSAHHITNEPTLSSIGCKQYKNVVNFFIVTNKETSETILTSI